MHIHIINFNLSGINRSEYEAAASELTTALLTRTITLLEVFIYLIQKSHMMNL